MARSFTMTTDMDWNAAGYTSRGLNAWVLSHSTLNSWKHFYHKPYAFDWAEATDKAIERYMKETGYWEEKRYDINYNINGSYKTTKKAEETN